MAERYYIGKEHWGSVLRGWLEKYSVWAPQKETGGLFLQPVTPENIGSIVRSDRYSYRSPDVYDRHNENGGDGGLFELEVIVY